jgi:membrane fusion protein (multidrug efflux system)
MTVCAAWGAAAQAPGTSPIAPASVIVARAEIKPFDDRVEAIGTLKSFESASLSTNVSEVISALHFQDGQAVKKGDVLVEMTSREEAAELKEAKSTLTEAEKQFARAAELTKSGNAPLSLLDTRQRDLDNAKARIKAVESRLADRLVTAPFDGILGLRNVSVGSLVEPGIIITTIEDISRMKLDLPVPEVYLPSLKTGLKVFGAAPSISAGNINQSKVFQGEITAIDNKIDEDSRSVQVRAIIENTDFTLKPGMLVNAEIAINERTAVVIPESAIIPKGRGNFVMRVSEVSDKKESSAKMQKVVIGSRRPGYVEITDGLKAGDLVITHGNNKVKDGQPVIIKAIDDGTKSLQEMLNTEGKKGN